MATKRIATTALDWGVLAAKIPAENKVRMHYHVCRYSSFFFKDILVFRAVLWIRICFSPDPYAAFYLDLD
jgi:hypothetical protein